MPAHLASLCSGLCACLVAAHQAQALLAQPTFSQSLPHLFADRLCLPLLSGRLFCPAFLAPAAVVRCMADAGYNYVENLTWVLLAANHNVLRLPSPLSCQSHLSLYIFRREGEWRAAGGCRGVGAGLGKGPQRPAVVGDAVGILSACPSLCMSKALYH